MPTCLFILARFTLRVDNVLFRDYDSRIYHSFTSSPPVLVRETSGWEAPYERVKKVRHAAFLSGTSDLTPNKSRQKLPMRDDLTPLTDPAWIAKILTELPNEISQEIGAGTRWRGLGTKVEVATLVSDQNV